jgi:hypothetical protein
MNQQLIYTNPIQITAVQGENKKVQTKYGEKEQFSFKGADNNWYTSWETDKKNQSRIWFRNGNAVIIGYQSREWNGKTYRTAKMVNPVESSAPSQSPQNGSGATVDKDESIARAVALKAAVELVVGNRDATRCVLQSEGNDLFKLADECLVWLKNEQPKQPTQTHTPPMETIDVDQIPF